jgi:hypothetical protein
LWIHRGLWIHLSFYSGQLEKATYLTLCIVMFWCYFGTLPVAWIRDNVQGAGAITLCVGPFMFWA